jgi:hypothetical protein
MREMWGGGAEKVPKSVTHYLNGPLSRKMEEEANVCFHNIFKNCDTYNLESLVYQF